MIMLFLFLLTAVEKSKYPSAFSIIIVDENHI